MNAAMSTAQTAGKFYVAGGTLCTDAASYIVREADERLFQSLQEGNFSYVLTSRQMGKSSLMVRTATRLKADGVGVSIADLSAIGQNLSADQWYYGLAERIGGQYGFQDARIEEIWSRNPHYPPVRRWMSFVDELLRDNPQDRLVIFIDEIDTVRSLSFSTDEFFASIRSFYNGRTVQTEYRRLTFCLLGVAAPAELIRNPLTTPFNIGTRIELNDFTEAEASPLAAGLGGGEGDTKRLCRVLRWTRGHPYLTQRLCQALATARDSNSVDEICGSTFLGSRASASDENLAFVRDYLLHIDVDTAALLKVYQRIRLGRRIADSETDPSITALRLSGICQARDGHLQVRNPHLRARVRPALGSGVHAGCGTPAPAGSLPTWFCVGQSCRRDCNRRDWISDLRCLPGAQPEPVAALYSQCQFGRAGLARARSGSRDRIVGKRHATTQRA